MTQASANNKTYREYKKLDFPAFEKEVMEFWKTHAIFQKSISSREGKPAFVFYEGPPSANGKPGIHHVTSRAIKDMFCRYQTLKGFQVNRKAGWDTHGLPVELQVEKSLGITKDDIGKKISIEEYNRICKTEVMKFTDIWNDLTEKIGYWVDLKHPYITYNTKYIETLWWLLKQFYQKNLLYKGYTIQPYSPAAGTGLSSHELNQPGTYKPLKDTTIVAMFKAVSGQQWSINNFTQEDVYFLAWTTTPWTLPSNTALAVGKNIDYVLVKTYNQYTGQLIHVVLAEALMGKYFSEKAREVAFDEYKAGDKVIPFEVIGKLKGADLESIRYEQLLPYAKPAEGDAFRVIIGDFVSTEDGTGIVHIAPSFGADDFRVAKQNGIGALTLVDKRGRFTAEVTDFANEFVKEQYLSDEEKETERKKQGRDKYLSVDERISIKLKEENKAFKVEKYEHNYPHCWRTDKPVLYYPLESWFIKTTACKDRLVELNKTINWKPASTGTGRFGEWLNNLVDWNLSRSRFWGTPLPIWKTEDGSEEICIGSLPELQAEADKAVKAGFMSEFHAKETDLHRPHVDNIILVSPSGKKMFREPDLIDVWFDSGAMPYAQQTLNYDKLKAGDPFPFGEGEVPFPADYIAEGVDQTRGWFFTLHVIAVMLFDSIAYKNVIANGLVLDKNGNKMSKRLGNVVDPFETVEKYGADAVRWYLISNSDPWDNLKFDMEGVGEVQRKLFGTLYNTYSFFALYANIDGFTIDEHNITPVAQRPELDRWIISRLHSLVKKVTAAMDDYDPTPAARAIEEFVGDHLSNWYVRLSRKRFWRGEMNEDKKAAYETLYECLMVTAQLMSPIAPFFPDWLYRNLTESVRGTAAVRKTPLQYESVHLGYLTRAEENLIDAELEEQMALAQKLSSMVLSLRKKVNIKVRQPLQRVLVPLLDKAFADRLAHVKDLFLAEVNVKELEFLTEDKLKLVKKIKPDFKLLGPRVGNKMKELAAAVAEMTQAEIKKLEQEGTYTFKLSDTTFDLAINEVSITADDIPGWQVAVDGPHTIALDITITPELEKEGFAREFINRIQNLRKDSGFEVTEKITVVLEDNEMAKSAIELHKVYICAEILAGSIVWESSVPDGKEIDVNEQLLKVKIRSSIQ